jgi:hypothetical protein
MCVINWYDAIRSSLCPADEEKGRKLCETLQVVDMSRTLTSPSVIAPNITLSMNDAGCLWPWLQPSALFGPASIRLSLSSVFGFRGSTSVRILRGSRQGYSRIHPSRTLQDIRASTRVTVEYERETDRNHAKTHIRQSIRIGRARGNP